MLFLAAICDCWRKDEVRHQVFSEGVMIGDVTKGQKYMYRKAGYAWNGGCKGSEKFMGLGYSAQLRRDGVESIQGPLEISVAARWHSL